MLMPDDRARLARHADAIRSVYPSQIPTLLSIPGAFRDGLRLDRHDDGGNTVYECFYAPFDWLNPNAKVVLVGITPGLGGQGAEALKTLRESVGRGMDLDAAAEAAKAHASFRGLRDELERMCGHLGITALLRRAVGIERISDLFDRRADLLHCTSTIRYPVIELYKRPRRRKDKLVHEANFGGIKGALRHPFLGPMIRRWFAAEVALLPDAWFVALGPAVADTLNDMAAEGFLPASRVLPLPLHPSGQQRNRLNYLYGETPREKCLPGVGCDQIDAAVAVLKERLARAETALQTA